MFRARIYFVMVFCLMLISASCQLFESDSENSQGDPSSKWEMWSETTRLRGANIYQRQVYPELDGSVFMGTGPVGPPYTQADFNDLSAMGANYVNISHPGIYTENPPYKLDSEILEHLVHLVEMIGQADMFAVISFRTGPGRSEFTFFRGEDDDWFDSSYYNDEVWVSHDAQNAWIEMWRETASWFKDNHYVVGYDLMVEPNSNEVWLDIWDQEEFYDRYSNTLYDWNQLFPGIIQAIREIDTETPVLVGGMGYSAVDWLPYIVPVSDSKTLYVVHQYAPVAFTHQNPGGPFCYPGNFDADWDGQNDIVDKNWLSGLFNTISNFKSRHGCIVACNEYGVIRWVCGAAQFMEDQMGFFEDHNLNYALWVWEPSWQLWSEEVNAFNFRFGPDPNNTTDLNSSELIEVIKKYWARNSLRPSTLRHNKQKKNESR
jgi:hypothetical protein